MPVVVGARWREGAGYDVHVFRGQSASPALKSDIEVIFDDGSVKTADALPASVVIFYSAFFDGAPKAHGVTLDKTNGSVKADSSSTPELRNFLVQVLVTEELLILGMFYIQIHVHDRIKQIALTPQRLTVRAGAKPQRLTLLATFDDGTMADMSAWPDLEWTAGPGGIAVNIDTGEITAANASAASNIKAKLPADLPSDQSEASAEVVAAPSWSDLADQPTLLSFIAGKGARDWQSIVNVLFLSEGFPAHEQSLFEELVDNIVKEGLTKDTTTSPFNLLAKSMNYWRAFIPSSEPGISIQPECYVSSRRGALLSGQPVNPFYRPSTPDQSDPEKWSLRDLVHMFGLPTPADDGPSSDTPETRLAKKREVWKKLYGSKADKIDRLRVSVFKQWLELATRQLFEEPDTAFGIAMGERPRREGTFIGDSHSRLHPRRAQPEDLDEFLRHLISDSEPVGTTWAFADDTGKIQRGLNRSRVVIVARSQRGGGLATPALIAVTAGDATAHPLFETLDGKVQLLGSATISRTPTTRVKTTVAHELAHTFFLADEYADQSAVTLPKDQEPFLKTQGNVQVASEVLKTGAIDSSKIKWGKWPRVDKLETLVGPPMDLGGGTFRLLLVPGRAAAFKSDDVLFLRARFLNAFPDHYGPLVVLAEDPDDLTVIDHSGTFADDLALFLIDQAGKPRPFGVVVRAVVDDQGNPLMLMAKAIRDHISSSGGPLSAPFKSPKRPCVRTSGTIPTNLPKSLRKKKDAARYIGLYEGGARHFCGVFHPSGVCELGTDSGRGSRPFCHVCRYVLVDLIDPAQHERIDELYKDAYPT